MQLTLETPAPYAIARIDAEGIEVAGCRHRQSFAVGPRGLIAGFAPPSLAALGVAELELLLAERPDLILLGTGPRLRFPAAALRAHVLARGVGFEVMDNAAAARTYNVLLGEARHVLVAFILG
jgi:uncharacterized protein